MLIKVDAATGSTNLLISVHESEVSTKRGDGYTDDQLGSGVTGSGGDCIKWLLFLPTLLLNTHRADFFPYHSHMQHLAARNMTAPGVE